MDGWRWPFNTGLSLWLRIRPGLIYRCGHSRRTFRNGRPGDECRLILCPTRGWPRYIYLLPLLEIPTCLPLIVYRLPGTYGVVTSAIVKAYPPVRVAETPIRFSVGTFRWGNATAAPNSTTTVPVDASTPMPPTKTAWPTNITIPWNQTRPFNRTRQGPSVILNDTNTFWDAVNAYFAFGASLCDAGGPGYSYVSRSGANTSF